MELVIRVPDEMWERVKDGYVPLGISKYLMNGIPLPKGHGNLIDADELDDDLKERQKSYEHSFGIRQPINEAIKDGIIIARTHINYTPTIIEADKEGE